MLVLGWHGSPRLREFDDCQTFAFHDAAAVMVRDGCPVAAIEEERLTRIKHTNCFPTRAIGFCLEQAKVSLRDVDAIVTDVAEDYFDVMLGRDGWSDPQREIKSARTLLAETFARDFEVDVADKLRFCRHHIAHLHSAWYPAGFASGLVVCIDGDGDGASGLIARCTGSELKILRTLPESQSLGNFYTAMLRFVGYQRFDEYKVMGLAPYGDPSVHAALFARMYQLQSEGRFTLASSVEQLLLLKEAGLWSRALCKGEQFTQEHKDFAAGLQATLERIVEHVVNHFQSVTGLRHLCLAGGVAHNCSLNGKLLRSGRFERVYVQPAAHDAGNALGAALAITSEAGVPIPSRLLPHVFLGTDVGDSQQIAQRLSHWRGLIEINRVDDAAALAAEQIASGAVIAWVQGRSEFGPRALGNRSILADPRPEENRRIVNAMVKKREGYRPFAPAVLEERCADFFEVPPGFRAAPFMTFVVPVRQAFRQVLGAITHVDGSARIQTVSAEDNRDFHALIAAFGQRTGIPIVLNTSYNNNAEPIVDSVDDAVITFLTTAIHVLFVGNWQVRKVERVVESDAFLDLVPSLAPCYRLARRTGPNGDVFAIEAVTSRYFVKRFAPVSTQLFQILAATDAISLRLHAARLQLSDAQSIGRLVAESYDLWAARMIRLHPVAASA